MELNCQTFLLLIGLLGAGISTPALILWRKRSEDFIPDEPTEDTFDIYYVDSSADIFIRNTSLITKDIWYSCFLENLDSSNTKLYTEWNLTFGNSPIKRFEFLVPGQRYIFKFRVCYKIKCFDPVKSKVFTTDNPSDGYGTPERPITMLNSTRESCLLQWKKPNTVAKFVKYLIKMTCSSDEYPRYVSHISPFSNIIYNLTGLSDTTYYTVKIQSINRKKSSAEIRGECVTKPKLRKSDNEED